MTRSYALPVAMAVLTFSCLASLPAAAQDSPGGFGGRSSRFGGERSYSGDPGSDRGFGGRGGFDRGGSGFDRGGMSRGGFDRGSFDRSSFDRRRSESGMPGGPGGAPPANGAAPAANQSGGVYNPTYSKMTVALPSTYLGIDSDGDGQVGLYEWRKAKRSLAEFTRLDLNSDGFLTPSELSKADSSGMSALASVPASTGSTTTSTSVTPAPSTTSTTTVAVATPAAAPTPKTPEQLAADAKVDEAQARNFFSSLDRNRDGKLTEDEMANSRTLRPLFEKAGYSFKEPMSAEQFVANYLEIRKTSRT